MNNSLLRVIKWVGYPLFAVVVFVLAFFFTFPYERLKERVEGFVNAGSDKYDLSIGELGPSLLFGITARDVVLRVKADDNKGPAVQTTAAGAQGAGAQESGPRYHRVVLEEASASVGIFALIGGNADVSFDVEGLGGTLEGRYTVDNKKKDWSLDLELAALEIKRLPMVADAVGLPIAGKFSGKVELEVPKGKLDQASGKIRVACEKCMVGDGKAKLKVPGNPLLASGLTVPRVRLGTVSGQVEVDKGVASLKNFSGKSPDMELALEGGFTLRQPLPFSTVSAYLKFKFSPALKKRDAKFELVESGLSAAKRPDGFFGLRLSGTLRNLRPIPSRTGPTGPGGRPPGPGGPGFRRFPGRGALPQQTTNQTPRLALAQP